MSTRKTKSESETPTPAPRKRKTAAADLSTPKTTRSRRKVTTAPAISEATDTSVEHTELSHEAIATRANSAIASPLREEPSQGDRVVRPIVNGDYATSPAAASADSVDVVRTVGLAGEGLSR